MSDALWSEELVSFPAMTLREYYAGLAMQGAIANDKLLTRIEDGDRGAMQFCVAWADALIAELQRENNDE